MKDLREQLYQIYIMKWMMDHGHFIDEIFDFASKKVYFDFLQHKGMLTMEQFNLEYYPNQTQVVSLISTLTDSEKEGTYGDKLLESYLKELDEMEYTR